MYFVIMDFRNIYFNETVGRTIKYLDENIAPCVEKNIMKITGTGGAQK